MSEDKKDNEFFRKHVVLDFATLNSLILKDLTKTSSSSSLLKKYKRSEVSTFMDNPAQHEKSLRDVSNTLFSKSPQYKRLIQYFAKMLTLDYIVEPVNVDFDKVNVESLSRQYKKAVQFLDSMNIKHEFSKVLSIAFREDIFYGYEHIGKNSYFIQKLNPNYCTISSIEDGCFNFAFDFSYFQSNLDQLEMYPPEFKSMYNKYLKDSKLKWQELDSAKTICIKINEDLDNVIPPFVGVFESLLDIEDFKALRKDREKIANYKVLYQKLPMRKDSEHNNDFSIDFENMMMFHNKASQALPDEVGLITAPFEVTDISFDKDKADADNVEKATRDYWTQVGVSQLLFNTDKSSSVGLEKSIRTDEAIIFTVLRQIERWVNRRLKFFINNINFRVNFLDITIFNKQEIFENALQASQFGVPAKMIIGASMGMSPSSMVNMAILENEILGLPERLIPLSSSHTGGAESETDVKDTNGGQGRPKKADSKIGEKGVKGRDNEKGTGE
ncbi:hypothetical protein MKY96_33190 [Paenibacillus sp. FSL R7-0302]|uniref:hypothetical protein n=1 Tax=Paenibacillus sp. FSL R7-0302 TaxID=2921681 RepID=UPI0030F9F18B